MSDAAQTPLNLYNSLTRSLETFEPVHAGEARVYSCGPTVYNYQHIGNMRAYIFADTLGRVLRWKGYELTHVINITDVGHLTSDADAGDDKMEKAAAQSGKDIWEIARHYTDAFWADIDALNITAPAKWSIATDHIEEMIAFAAKIADRHCYELESGLYFDSATVPDYGSLARAVTEDGEGRIGTVDGKRHQSDFAIWRKSPEGEQRQMEWDSPWGKGAPGWHLECSVMSMKYLGEKFDIHTGGIDHREIHHPNEIAQNQAHNCTAHSGANIWMHNNFLIDRSKDIGAGKMSKSSGDFLRLEKLVERGYHSYAYRMLCLQAHYRSELEFTWDNLLAALTRLKRILMGMQNLRARLPEWPEAKPTIGDAKVVQALADFDAAISADLNTPKALTIFEQLLDTKKVDVEEKYGALLKMDKVLGFRLTETIRETLRIRPMGTLLSPADIEERLAERTQARADKDFAKSDEIRDTLVGNRVEVMDGDPLQWDWILETS